jgi:hypothetical protein
MDKQQQAWKADNYDDFYILKLLTICHNLYPICVSYTQIHFSLVTFFSYEG